MLPPDIDEWSRIEAEAPAGAVLSPSVTQPTAADLHGFADMWHSISNGIAIVGLTVAASDSEPVALLVLVTLFALLFGLARWTERNYRRRANNTLPRA